MLVVEYALDYVITRRLSSIVAENKLLRLTSNIGLSLSLPREDVFPMLLLSLLDWETVQLKYC